MGPPSTARSTDNRSLTRRRSRGTQSMITTTTAMRVPAPSPSTRCPRNGIWTPSSGWLSSRRSTPGMGWGPGDCIAIWPPSSRAAITRAHNWAPAAWASTCSSSLVSMRWSSSMTTWSWTSPNRRASTGATSRRRSTITSASTTPARTALSSCSGGCPTTRRPRARTGRSRRPAAASAASRSTAGRPREPSTMTRSRRR